VTAQRAAGGSIVDDPRWRAGVVLGGMGNAVASLLPLFALFALELPVAVAAGTVSAYMLGTLVANLLLWGRLADRVRSPRALVIAGTAAKGALLLAAAVFPARIGILALSALLGAFAVSADGALMRLVVGNLDQPARVSAVLRYTRLVQRGALAGLAFTTLLLPPLREALDEQLALRVAIGALGVLTLGQSVLAATTIGFSRAAPRLGQAVTDLAASGVLVAWSGAFGPVEAVLRLARPGMAAARARLSDSLRLMFLSLFVLHLGFAMHGGIFALYLRQEAQLANGAVVGVLLAGAVMTDFTVGRVSRWLESVPAVQLQVSASAVRAGLYVAFALLAIRPLAAWSIAAIVAAYLVNQMAWGIIVLAHVRRLADLAPPARRAVVMAYHGASTGGGAVIGVAVAGAIAGASGFRRRSRSRRSPRRPARRCCSAGRGRASEPGAGAPRWHAHGGSAPPPRAHGAGAPVASATAPARSAPERGRRRPAPAPRPRGAAGRSRGRRGARCA